MQSETERDRDGDRETKINRQRQRDRDAETDRQRQRDRQTETETAQTVYQITRQKEETNKHKFRQAGKSTFLKSVLSPSGIVTGA